MSREFHEKIAAAIEALGNAEAHKPVVSVTKVTPTVKVAAAPIVDRYTKLTGEDLPPEVAENPAAIEALRKMAHVSGTVNELGDPSDRFDRGSGRPIGRTKSERIKEAYASFGDELLRD